MLIDRNWDIRCRNLKLVNKTGKIVLPVPSWADCTGSNVGSWSDFCNMDTAWTCKLQCTGRPSCVTFRTSVMKDLNVWRIGWKWLIFQWLVTNFLHISAQSTYTQNTWEDRGNLALWFSTHIQHMHGAERRRHYECYRWWKLSMYLHGLKAFCQTFHEPNTFAMWLWNGVLKIICQWSFYGITYQWCIVDMAQR